ncbi:sensor histidine kinase [Suttonella ornithocola]|uniref:histidine kinase n=1 Tax=Suttonella ornithocola TaxID=279832 RepID=A0A380MRC5_9GAMM|nr:HAMP domain-containing sensor histidine kinase [Suttonella ornithocola]SUO94596.1 Sensor protein ZraS [Suttonella ornithocola]
MKRTRQQHMVALNNPMQMGLAITTRSLDYRKNILQTANFVRLLFCLLALIFSPWLLGVTDSAKFLWSANFPLRGHIVVLGSFYIVVMASLTLYALDKRLDDGFFLFNALIDLVFVVVFILTLDFLHNWQFLGMCLIISILLSLLTLNVFQCAIYTIFLYAEVMLIYSLWQAYGDLEWSNLYTRTMHEHFSSTFQTLYYSFSVLGNAALIFAGMAVLVFLVGYLANNARENKILAGVNQAFFNQSRLLNESIIAEMPNGLAVVNGKGEIVAINRQMREIFRLQEESEVPFRLYGLSVELTRMLSRWQDVGNEDLQPLSLFGEIYSVTFTPLALEGYAPLIVASLENVQVSYQRVRETRLAALGRLTAGIAHEIRNPLGSVQSANELISELTDNQQILYLTRKIMNNSKRMNNIISDILDMFTDRPASPEKIILNPFLQQLVVNAKDNDVLEKVPILLKIDESKGLAVSVDPSHLTQVLHNLMLNAVTHSDQNELKITLATHLDEGKRSLFLDVIDNGKGVEAGDYERIFEPFFSSRKGTGLGLYLVREMCLANGASINYVPNQGGACFRIRLDRYLSGKTTVPVNSIRKV